MGYTTNYYGQINLFDEKAIKIIKKMIKEEKEPFTPFENDIYINNTNKKKIALDINCNWKDYYDGMLKLCLFVATLDKKSYGEVKCEGEEVGDIWNIKIKEGDVYRKQGYIKYDKGEEFKDIKTKKQVYDITKDKKLMKEILVDNLE